MQYEEFLASFCQCGTITSEWLDEGGKLKAQLPYKLKSRKCYGCALIEVEQKKLSKESGTEGVALLFERA